MDQAARGLDRRRPSATVATVVLLGAGAGYGGGNIGPVTGAIASRFGISLSAVGLTMTVFFATITAVTIASAPILRRLGPAEPRSRCCCVLSGLGNVICAVSPSFAGLLVGRGVVGVGAGLAFVIGPVVARAHGGARMIGAFGAAVTLGVAAALAIGSALAAAGVSWRIAFAISALVGAAALAPLPRRLPGATGDQPRRAGFIARRAHDAGDVATDRAVHRRQRDHDRRQFVADPIPRQPRPASVGRRGLFPDARAEVIAVLQTGPNVVPMAVIPAVGAALDSGHGAVAWLALAAFLVAAAVLNLRAPRPAPAYP